MRTSLALKWRLLLPLAVSGLLLFAVRCGDNSAPVDYLLSGPEGDKLPLYLEKASEATEVSELIDAEAGGEIDFVCDNGAHKFIVEPGSMPVASVIEIAAWTKLHEGQKLLRLNFGPAGLQFVPPARAVIDAFPLWGEVSSLKLYWYDPKSEEWELQEAVAVDLKGKALFRVYHFSKYAISR